MQARISEFWRNDRIFICRRYPCVNVFCSQTEVNTGMQGNASIQGYGGAAPRCTRDQAPYRVDNGHCRARQRSKVNSKAPSGNCQNSDERNNEFYSV